MKKNLTNIPPLREENGQMTGGFSILSAEELSTAKGGGTEKKNSKCSSNGTCKDNGTCEGNSKCISNGSCINPEQDGNRG